MESIDKDPAYNWPVIELLYNNAAQTILAMSDELNELKIKYGEASGLVQKKAKALGSLVQLHDRTREIIFEQRRVLRMAEIVDHYKDMIIMQHESGLPWEKVARAYGIEAAEGRKMQSDDDKIKAMYVRLTDILGPDYGIE